jgi:hypothetical protein
MLIFPMNALDRLFFGQLILFELQSADFGQFESTLNFMQPPLAILILNIIRIEPQTDLPLALLVSV